jgi:ABC-type phosphate transport system substrate-binding protein
MRALLGLIVAVALIFLIIAVVDLDGCGLDGDAGGENEGTLTTPEEQASEESGNGSRRQPQDLPPRPAGVVDIEGPADGSLTTTFVEGDAETAGFSQSIQASGLNVQPNITVADEATGFADLCAGRIDIVDSSRAISTEEVERCERNGLQLVEFQIAYDAVVLATRNEKDVGADCVSLTNLRNIFEAGSPVEAWNQVEPFFFPVRLDTTGPTEESTDFDFTFSRILGVPDPTIGDLREDYQPFDSEQEVGRTVWKNPKGVLGVVGFSFYGLNEDKLRPLEIDGETGDSCVFPSEETIASLLYPFARGLRLYTTTRGLQRAEVREFLRSFVERSQDIALLNDFIALSDPVRRVQLNRIDNPTALADGELVDENGVIVAARLPTQTTAPEAGSQRGQVPGSAAGEADGETQEVVPAPGTSGTIAEQRAPDAADGSGP